MNGEITDLTRGVYRRIYGGFIYGQRINKLSLEAEAWFWRLLVIVDDFGNSRADPQYCYNQTIGERRKVKPQHIGKWLREMQQVHLVSIYRAKGEDFLHIEGFEENQPAGKNGKRLKRWPLISEGESKDFQVNPDLSSASDTHTHNDTDNKDMSRAAQARRVFQFWQEHLKHPKAILDAKRQRAIEGRLRDGYTEEMLIVAVKGCKLTPYNMGENREHKVYNDIELICRDAAHVDRFVSAVPSENGSKPKVTESAEAKAIRESCLRCFGTGTERTEKGARVCKHEEIADGSNGVVCPGSSRVESLSQGSEGRVS